MQWRALLSTEIFMPRGHSYLWTPWLLIAELASNAVLALALLVIAFRLLRRGRNPEPGPAGRTDQSRNPRTGSEPPAAGSVERSSTSPTRIWLGILALALAATHLSDVWTIWTPAYGVDVGLRALAALVAIAAAVWI